MPRMIAPNGRQYEIPENKVEAARAAGMDDYGASKRVATAFGNEVKEFAGGIGGMVAGVGKGVAKIAGGAVQTGHGIITGDTKKIESGFEMASEPISDLGETVYSIGKEAVTAPFKVVAGFGKAVAAPHMHGFTDKAYQMSQSGMAGAAEGASTLAAFAPTLGGQAISSTLSAGARMGQAQGQGQRTDLAEDVGELAGDITSRAGFLKLMNVAKNRLDAKKFNKPKDAPKTQGMKDFRAESVGISNRQINSIARASKVSPGQAKAYLEQSMKSYYDDAIPTSAQAHSNKLMSGVNKLKDLKVNIGKEIGSFKDKIAGSTFKINPKPTQDALSKIFGRRDIGVKVTKKGRLNFKDSIFKNSDADKKFINNLWREAKKSGNADSILRRLDRIADDLYGGKARLEFSDKLDQIAESARSGYRMSIDDFAIQNNMSRLLDLNKKYSDINNQLYNISRFAGKDVRLPGMTEVDKMFTVVRQASGAGGNAQNYKNLLNNLEKIGKKYGVNEFDGAFNFSSFSNTIDDVLGIKPTTGLQSQIEGALSGAITAPSQTMLGKVIQKGTEKIIGSPEQNIKRLIESHSKSGIRQYAVQKTANGYQVGASPYVSDFMRRLKNIQKNGQVAERVAIPAIINQQD